MNWTDDEPVEELSEVLDIEHAAANPALRPAEAAETVVLPEANAGNPAGNGAGPRVKTYMCEIPGCGEFQQAITRGQPPKRCPEHRKLSGQQLARIRAQHALMPN